MTEARSFVDHPFVRLYQEKLEQLLTEHDIPTASFAPALRVLEEALVRKPYLSACFLGGSQVGKSTLINAVLGQRVLPSGGVGPLTAQATRVSFSPEGGLTVTYHPRQKLSQLQWVLENYLRKKALLQGGASQPPEEAETELLTLLMEPPESPTGATEPKDDPEEERQIKSVSEYMLDQASAILTDGLVPKPLLSPLALLDGLRAVLGLSLYGAPEEIAPLQGRIAQIQELLGKTEQISESSLSGQKEFERALALRATGWMAPLVAELDLRLSATLLSHITLVDLPGIGVVGDAARRVAEEHVRTEADTLVLVMRNDGLNESVAQLLEQTGVITKLLFGGREGAPPIHVMVVVTCLDNVARERYDRAMEELGDEDEEEPIPDEMFKSLAEEMQTKVRQQIEAALKSSSAFEDLPEALRARRESIVQKLCQSMDIVCVAAPDYMRLTSKRESIRQGAFLKTLEGTGVPAFIDCLRRLESRFLTSREEAIRKAEEELKALIEDHLLAVEQMYADREGRSAEDWDRLRETLLEEARELGKQAAVFRGEVLNNLHQSIPLRIQSLVQNSAQVALKRLRKLRKQGENRAVHYHSLKAALLRNGVWQKRNIDYPDQLTRALVDSIASQWEPVVVDSARAAVDTLVARDQKLVEKLCEVAKAHDDSLVAEARIEGQLRLMQHQARTCISWTDDRLRTLQEDISKRLYKVVLDPIESACRKAVKESLHKGQGAKIRILDTFEEGGEQAIEKAQGRARKILDDHYQKLIAELSQNFLAQNADPLQAAVKALTRSELLLARKADALRRREVLEAIVELKQKIAA